MAFIKFSIRTLAVLVRKKMIQVFAALLCEAKLFTRAANVTFAEHL